MSAAAFLFWEGFSVLNRFARYAQRPSLFACALLLALVLSAGLWLPVAVLLKGGFPEPHALAALWLSSAGQLLLTVSLPGRGACAAASVGLTLGQALFGGGFFPEALLPPVLFRLAGWLPLTLRRSALGAACFGAGEGAALLLLAAGFFAAAALVSGLLWNRERRNLR